MKCSTMEVTYHEISSGLCLSRVKIEPWSDVVALYRAFYRAQLNCLRALIVSAKCLIVSLRSVAVCQN